VAKIITDYHHVCANVTIITIQCPIRRSEDNACAACCTGAVPRFCQQALGDIFERPLDSVSIFTHDVQWASTTGGHCIIIES
jgi:hypothetical protein